MKATGSSRYRTSARLFMVLATAALTACFPIKFEARMPLPQPLIAKVPFTVALYVPPEFAAFMQKEKRSGLKWEVALGKAQAEGFTRLVNSMFERVIVVDSIAAARGQPVRAILEPSIDEYAFVTSRETGSPFFAVSIKYRMGIYTPEGRLAESWAFTGYGSAPTAGMSDEDSLSRATTLALRDAAAKLAVEFRDQEIVRELLPPPDTAGTAPSTEPAAPTEGESPSSAPPTQAPSTSEVPVEAEPGAPTAPAPAAEPPTPPASPPSLQSSSAS